MLCLHYDDRLLQGETGQEGDGYFHFHFIDIAQLSNSGQVPRLIPGNEFRQLTALPSVFGFVFHLTVQLSDD